jgi:hypothetical protein
VTIIGVYIYIYIYSQSRWPCDLRCGSTAARLLGSWVRIPPGAWMFVSCECCVLSGRGLCDELITRPEESYRLWCVSNVCDHETSTKRGGPGPYKGCRAIEKKSIQLKSQRATHPTDRQLCLTDNEAFLLTIQPIRLRVFFIQPVFRYSHMRQIKSPFQLPDCCGVIDII